MGALKVHIGNGGLLSSEAGYDSTAAQSPRVSSATGTQRGVNFNLEEIPAELTYDDNVGWLHKTTTLTSTTKSLSMDSHQFAFDCDYGERKLIEDPSDLFEDGMNYSLILKDSLKIL